MNQFLTSKFKHFLPAVVLATSLCAAASANADEPAADFLGNRMPYAAFDRLPATRLEVSGANLIVAFAPGSVDLPRARVLDRALSAVRLYPLSSARILPRRTSRGTGYWCTK